MIITTKESHWWFYLLVLSSCQSLQYWEVLDACKCGKNCLTLAYVSWIGRILLLTLCKDSKKQKTKTPAFTNCWSSLSNYKSQAPFYSIFYWGSSFLQALFFSLLLQYKTSYVNQLVNWIITIKLNYFYIPGIILRALYYLLHF